MRDEKIQCSFISEDGESLEISYREGMAKVILMDFPEDEESAENLLYPNEITGENSISDFMVKTANEGKDNESSFYRFQVKNSQQIPIAFLCGVKTENEGYQIIWKKGSGSTNVYTLADLTVDTAARTAKRGGRTLELSAREYALLEYLIRSKGVVLSRQQIEDNLWSLDYAGGTNVVDVYISYLRKKLELPGERKLLHTVRGMGWVLKEDA